MHHSETTRHMKRNRVITLSTIAVTLCCAILLLLHPSRRPATAEPTPLPTIHSDTVRLLFGGDLMQHTPQINAALTAEGHHDYSTSFVHIAPLFRAADVAVVNLETTLTPTPPYTGYPRFSAPAALAQTMAQMGIDIALLANNHICDKGSHGIRSTIEHLKLNNIITAGAWADTLTTPSERIVRFERRGIRFALLNYTYGTNGLPIPEDCEVALIDTATMSRDLSLLAEEEPDCIIACLHWGNEYERQANTTQRSLADYLHSRGVDLIIGSHPHVVQPFEAEGNQVTFYSLGNLVSNQRQRFRDGGLLAEVEVIKCDTVAELTMRATAHPVWVLTPGYQILPRAVGDTLTMEATSRARYEQFMADTDQLLGTAY